MMDAKKLAQMIWDTLALHSQFPNEPKKAFRNDGKTPSGTHPVRLAMLFLNEEHLPEDLRVRGVKALLAHDLLEDTTACLPHWANNLEVRELIYGLTFTKDQDKYTDVWHRG